MRLKEKAARGLMWSLVDKLVNQLGYLAVTIYMARIIGPDGVGLIAMLAIFTLLADSVVSNGFSQALIQKSHSMTSQDASTVFYVNLAWGVAIYSVFFVSAPAIAEFYGRTELVDISRVLLSIVIINSFSVVVRAKLIVAMDFKSQALSGAVAVLLSSLLGIYWVGEGGGYWALVWMMLCKAIVTNLGLWFFCKWWPSWVFSRESFNTLFRFGSNLMLAGILATIVNNLSMVLIGRYYSAVQVGYFSQATSLSNFLSTFVSSTLQGVAFPVMTSIKEDRTDLLRVYKYITSLTMLVSLPLMTGLALISDTFVFLFLGEEWGEVVPVLFLLCLARVVTPINSMNMSILNAIGRSDLFLKIDLLKLPLILASLFIALPYGVEIIAYSILVVSFISFFINAYYPGRLFGFGALEQLKLSRNYILAAVIMCLVLGLTSLNSSFINLGLRVLVGGFVYFICLWLLRDKVFLNLCSSFARYYKC